MAGAGPSGAVSTGEVAVRAGSWLTTVNLITAVTTVQPPVTELAGGNTEPLVSTLKLTGLTHQVVGPVARLDCVHTANLISFVLTVGHSVTPEAQADTGPVITPELVPGTAGRTVQLIISAVPQPVTPLFEGETGPVTAEELRPTAVSLTAGLV